MKYEAKNGECHAAVIAAVPHGGVPVAARLARAMNAVLLAARAWHAPYLEGKSVSKTRGPADDEHLSSRLDRACARLAKIEKEVSRG